MAVAKPKINPNAAHAAVFSANLSDPKTYPRFIGKVKFDDFRHIKALAIPFPAAVTVIAGCNRSGKTTALLSIACSHFEFKKRNYSNGKLERQTWSDVLKFTDHDKQKSDWTYHLDIKSGGKNETRRGQRKAKTKKWNGLGKKESQIRDVSVVYLDLDRILPARYYSHTLHKKARASTGTIISTSNKLFIEECFSYVLEEKYSLIKLADHLGRELLGFTVSHDYSSYNSASGEDVLSRILIDCIEAPPQSLILIDELELGLHPKVQRRLMDVIIEISRRDQKQFIITSHSATVLASVPDHARVFIDRRGVVHTAINPISINAVLSKMDSNSYPLIDIFCEDDVAARIIRKAVQEIENDSALGISARLLNVIVSGSAASTYQNFVVRSRVFDKVKVRSGHACILDGDMRVLKDKNGVPSFPAQDGMFFLFGIDPPEKILCDVFERANNSPSLRYHIDGSNVHCLFEKMVVISGFVNVDAAFDACWSALQEDAGLMEQFSELIEFLIGECRRYSPDL